MRIIRKAISPRLAIRMVWNGGVLGIGQVYEMEGEIKGVRGLCLWGDPNLVFFINYERRVA